MASQTLQLDALMPRNHVIDAALAESRAALIKHGPAVGDPVRGTCILGEELGEAMEQALKATSPDPNENCGQPTRDRLQLLRSELCQIAGYAMLQIENIDSGRTYNWLMQNRQTIK